MRLKTNTHERSLDPMAVRAFFVFWGIFFVLWLFRDPAHALILRMMPLRAEYMMEEQLSKYYLFIVILVTTYAYGLLRTPVRIKTCVCLWLLGLVMYLGESNMIKETAQMICGLVLFAYLFVLFAKGRALVPAVLTGIGVCLIGMGVAVDAVHELPALQPMVPDRLLAFLDHVDEELCDLVGQGFFSVAAILYFLGELRKIVRGKRIILPGLLVAAALVAMGNSFLHYQYSPGPKTMALGLVLSWAGLGGLVGIDAALRRLPDMTMPFGKEFITLFWLTFFLILPTIFAGQYHSTASFLLWVPLLGGTGFYLYRIHPAMTGRRQER